MAAIGSGLSLVSHIYTDRVRYLEGGDRNLKEGGKEILRGSAPHEPDPNTLNPPPKQKKTHEKEKKEGEERLLIPGVDTRVEVKNPQEYPNSIHVRIFMEFANPSFGEHGKPKRYRGSGSLIGPHHVLTCAHNVYKKNRGWATQIEVHAPSGDTAQVTRAHVFENWTNREDPEYDMALLILNWSIGYDSGYGILSCAKFETLKVKEVHLTGYSGPKMKTMEDRIKTVADNVFNYEIDTKKGQSGSAIWFDDWDIWDQVIEVNAIYRKSPPVIVGVHTRGGKNVNYGVRITEDKFKVLFEEMNKTYALAHRCFGEKEWEEHFKRSVGKKPPLPANIHQILDTQCELWKGKKIGETHALVLIPQHVQMEVGKPQPYSLNKCVSLLPQLTEYNQSVKDQIGKEKISESYWTLITRDVIPGSKGKKYKDQKDMLPQNYRPAKVIEVATAIMTTFADTGTEIYANRKGLTFTHCEEELTLEGKKRAKRPVFIGAFSEESGYIGHEKLTEIDDYDHAQDTGIAACMILPPPEKVPEEGSEEEKKQVSGTIKINYKGKTYETRVIEDNKGSTSQREIKFLVNGQFYTYALEYPNGDVINFNSNARYHGNEQVFYRKAFNRFRIKFEETGPTPQEFKFKYPRNEKITARLVE